MHLALSTMHLTLLSANMMALSDDISLISLSPILATISGSKPEKASLYYQPKLQASAQCSSNFLDNPCTCKLKTVPVQFLSFQNLCPIVVHQHTRQCKQLEQLAVLITYNLRMSINSISTYVNEFEQLTCHHKQEPPTARHEMIRILYLYQNFSLVSQPSSHQQPLPMFFSLFYFIFFWPVLYMHIIIIHGYFLRWDVSGIKSYRNNDQVKE